MNESVKVAIRMSDGSLAIMQFLTVGRGNVLPVGASWKSQTRGLWMREPSQDNIGVEVMRAFQSEGAVQPMSFRMVRQSDIPADREHRDALTDDGTTIGHDMVKARGMCMSKLRAGRAKEFERLDGEWMRATGQGNTAEADRIEAERQLLRTLPERMEPMILAAATVDDLKLIR